MGGTLLQGPATALAPPALHARSQEEVSCPPQEDATRKLWEMIKDIRIAMLASEDGDVLRSRPMAACQNDFTGTLWFFTHAKSAKVQEIADDARVCVSYADADAQNYVSSSGRARLVHDREVIAAHWSEPVRIPQGWKTRTWR